MEPIRNCAKAIIIRDSHLLTVKYSDQGGDYYALPGGGQLHGETLPEALMRELREELGLNVSNRGLRFIREYVGMFGESAWRDADIHQVEFLYECTIGEHDEPTRGSNPDQAQVDFAWLPIDQMDQIRFYPKRLIAYLGKPLSSKIEYWGAVE